MPTASLVLARANPAQETGMTHSLGAWTQIEVAGHPVDVYEPPQPHPHGYVGLYLHGVHLGKLTDKPAYLEQFARHGLRVMAPLTGRCWWTDKLCSDFDPQLTPEKYLLHEIVPAIRARWSVESPKIGLFGTSMGGQGALRIAFKHPQRFPVVAAVSPAIDYQQRWDLYPQLEEMYPDPEAARQDTATLHVHPLNWPRNIWFCSDPLDADWHDSAQRLHMKLRSLGILHETDFTTQAGGHSWDYYNHMAPAVVKFLMERLDAERRRLPLVSPDDV